MTEDKEDKKENKIPRRMVNIAFPDAKFGLILAILLIFMVLFILYKDVLFSLI